MPLNPDRQGFLVKRNGDNPGYYRKEDKYQKVNANGKIVLAAGSIPGEVGEIRKR